MKKDDQLVVLSEKFFLFAWPRLIQEVLVQLDPKWLDEQRNAGGCFAVSPS